MEQPRPRNARIITVGCFFAFCLFGFVDNLKGATLPAILGDLKINYSQGGILLLCGYLGFFVATILAGMLSHISGKKAVLIIAGAALSIGIAGYLFSHSFLLLACSMVLAGVFMGSAEVGCNDIIIDVHRVDKGRYLNQLSVFHGLGSMLAPFYAGRVMAGGFSWRLTYGTVLPFAVILLCAFLVIRYPRTMAAPATAIKKPIGLRFTRDIVFISIMLFFYVAAELSIGSWMVEFLVKAQGFSPSLGSILLTMFFGLMTAGRFAGSYIVDRVGYVRVLVIAMLLSTACIAAGIFGSQGFTWLLPVSGFFLSIVFPTSTAIIGSRQKENVGAALGLSFSIAGLGGMFGPWAVGVAGDLGGIQAGMSVIILYCFAALASLLLLRGMRRSGRREGT